MRVAVLGGGLQGCCAALALVERGARVTIIDRNDRLLARTAVANEGKIHLGYMYAGDPTLLTAKTMIKGALAFAPFFERHFGTSPLNFSTSAPAAYVVHRDSQLPVDIVSGYLASVHKLIEEAIQGRSDAYFGMDLRAAPRPWSRAERDAVFNPVYTEAAFETPEVAINPVELGQLLGSCIADHPLIDIAVGHFIVGVRTESNKLYVQTDDNSDLSRTPFDHVVNALWDGRLALDHSVGLFSNARWLHRLKYGVSLKLPAGAKAPQSATFVLGPFGEVVNYGDGLVYLTWYPECIHGISNELRPPHWNTYPVEPLRSRIIAGTLDAMSNIIYSIGDLDLRQLPEVGVKGGTVVARGETDIYDPKSELHRRYEIGVTSMGHFHSVDPGKLTMAPYFADLVAKRIMA